MILWIRKPGFFSVPPKLQIRGDEPPFTGLLDALDPANEPI